jgi:uncharacterized secreted protein with C-terminal beta-propeller domain
MERNDNNNAEQAMEEGDQTPSIKDSHPPVKKTTPFFKAPFVFKLSAFIIVAALAIGLGLGLASRNNNNINNNQTISLSTTGPKARISDVTTSSLALISGESLKKTYLDCDDLKVDARKLALLLANQTIHASLHSYYFMDEESKLFPTIQGGGVQVVTTEDSFGTNRLVEGVEEADTVQSDGKNIFMVYGTEVRYQATTMISAEHRLTSSCL